MLGVLGIKQITEHCSTIQRRNRYQYLLNYENRFSMDGLTFPAPPQSGRPSQTLIPQNRKRSHSNPYDFSIEGAKPSLANHGTWGSDCQMRDVRSLCVLHAGDQ